MAGVLQAPLVGPVTLYAPPSNMPVRGLALFLSGDGGWNLGVLGMARDAADLGLWVAGFSTPKYLHALDAQPVDACSDAAGTLTTLAANLKQQLDLPANLPVLLIGYSSGATTVYAALVQAAPHTFQGGLSLGFGPDIEARHAFCPGAGGLVQQKSPRPPHLPSFLPNAHVSAPWHILQGEIDEDVLPQFATDYTHGVPGAKVWLLPHVGHGFGVPRNWAPQYRAALESLLPPLPTSAKSAPVVPVKQPDKPVAR
jgi:type IV secretory pathway VirJ component